MVVKQKYVQVICVCVMHMCVLNVCVCVVYITVARKVIYILKHKFQMVLNVRDGNKTHKGTGKRSEMDTKIFSREYG